MSRNDDAEEILSLLESRLEEICDRYWSGWVPVMDRGVSVGLMTPRVKGKNKKPTSSFKVELSGPNRGRWFRFSDPDNSGGGPIALLFYGEYGRKLTKGAKQDWAEAFKLAREFLGMEKQRERSPEEKAKQEQRAAERRAEREAKARQNAQRAAEARAERTLDAKGVWTESVKPFGTPGDLYLQSRGFPPMTEWPWDPSLTLRFHPSLDYELDRGAGRWPALICRVTDAFNEGTGIWQIYVAKDGQGKAPLPNAKVGRGPAAGGAVRIGGDAASIGGGEGVETSLGAWFLEGCRKPVWSFLSTSGMVSFEPPAFVEKLEIFPDGDKARANDRGIISDRPGIKAARSLVANVAPILGAPNVSIAQEPTAGKDYHDIYLSAKERGLL